MLLEFEIFIKKFRLFKLLPILLLTTCNLKSFSYTCYLTITFIVIFITSQREQISFQNSWLKTDLNASLHSQSQDPVPSDEFLEKS